MAWGQRRPWEIQTKRKRKPEKTEDIAQEANVTTPNDEEPEHPPNKKVTRLFPVNIRSGRDGAHHCPHKDAAKTHYFNARCFVKKHAGYCPTCNKVVSYLYGCINDGWSGDDLGEIRHSRLRKPRTKDYTKAFLSMYPERT